MKLARQREDEVMGLVQGFAGLPPFMVDGVRALHAQARAEDEDYTRGPQANLLERLGLQHVPASLTPRSRIEESFRAMNNKRETYFSESCRRVFLYGMIAHDKKATQKQNHGIKAPEEFGTSHAFLELEHTW